jgi:phosphonate transport system substrate-binding protein
MKRRVLLSLALMVAVGAFQPGTGSAEDTLILAVHPFLPATSLLPKFEPLAAHLGRSLGRPVRVAISRDYDDHIRRVSSGEVDIAYMGPASYVKLVGTYGEVPLLARLEIKGNPAFHGVIFVHKDSPIQTLEEIAGKRFAFGSPTSTMGTLVPRHVLRQAGVSLKDLGGFGSLGNHDNIALAVLVGDFDAGAIKEETFSKYEPRGLRSLAVTPSISEHLFVAAADLPADTVAEVRKILLRTGEDEEGLEVLRSIKGTVSGFVPVEDGDYDNLRRILSEVEKAEVPP